MPVPDLRAAILAAADHIDANPNLYRDSETHIPESLNVHAGALGWIAYFAGYHRPDRCASGMALVLADMPQAFHHRMNDLDAGWRSWIWSWRTNSRRAAWCLHAYADRYHAIVHSQTYSAEPSSRSAVIPGLTDRETY